MTNWSCFARCLAIAAFLARSSAFVSSPRKVNSLATLLQNDGCQAPDGSKNAHTLTIAKTQLSVSPSGIDELPILAQGATFAGIYAALGISTIAGIKTLDVLSASVFGLERWRSDATEKFLPITLGLVYVAAGIGHFAAAEAFRSIYPPQGTWGLWYIPGSAEFHVAWTGAVEALGGLGLWYGAFQSATADDNEEESFILRLVQPISALALFVLTILVTPANIYMFTHGATLGPDMPALDLQFHIIRFTIQVILLSQLCVLAKDSFFFAWGDELD